MGDWPPRGAAVARAQNVRQGGTIVADEVWPERVRPGEGVDTDQLRLSEYRLGKAPSRQLDWIRLDLFDDPPVSLHRDLDIRSEDDFGEGRALRRILVRLEQFQIDSAQRDPARPAARPVSPDRPRLGKIDLAQSLVCPVDIRHLKDDVVDPTEAHGTAFYEYTRRVRDEPFFERVILRADGLDQSRFPLSVPAVRAIESVRFYPGVTVLAGENGSGKSTILEAIAVAAGFSPEGGTKGFRTESTPHDRGLAERLTLVRNPLRELDGFFLRAESAYILMSYINDVDAGVLIEPQHGPAFVAKPAPVFGDLHKRSHGESFMDIFQRRFATATDSLFILDEIESALSPQRQLEFLALMHVHVERGSSFIVSTHSPILMSYPRSRLYWLDEDGIAERDWRDTDHAVILQNYLARPEAMQRAIFGSTL